MHSCGVQVEAPRQRVRRVDGAQRGLGHEAHHSQIALGVRAGMREDRALDKHLIKRTKERNREKLFVNTPLSPIP